MSYHCFFKYFLPFSLFSSIIISQSFEKKNGKNYQKYVKKEFCIPGFIGCSFLIYFIIKKLLKNKETNNKKPRKYKNRIRSNIPLENYKNDVVKNLHLTDNDNSIYRQYEQTNNIGNTVSVYTKNLKSFYALFDQYETERGWACIWLCLQNVLASYNVFFKLESLYNRYKKYEDVFQETAELGYLEEALGDIGIKSEVWLYNRQNGTDKTSTFIGIIQDFPSLVKKIMNHFETYETPIVIDDVSHGYTILAIKELTNGNVMFWIADPYKDTKEDNLYMLQVNGKTGEKIHCTGKVERSGCTADHLDIQCKNGWIMLFPQEWLNTRETVELVKYDKNTLITLNDNSKVNLKQWTKVTVTDYGLNDFNNIAIADNMHFFGEFFQDEDGLGNYCAWRCIQMCLASLDHFYTVQSLLDRYRENLNIQKEWAEPGYLWRIFKHLRLDANVWLYNRESGTDKTKIFQQKVFGFPDLKKGFLNHFETNKTPIMIDDTLYAYVILGMKTEENDTTTLFIADPHKTTKKAGLYTVTLDQYGNQTKNNMQLGYGYDSANRIYFNNNNWLIALPQKN